MKRNVLKWGIVALAAVAVAAGAYLGLSRKPEEGKEKPAEKILEGHSKAFQAEPYEGITISAGEDALDKDRTFKIRPASEKEWARAEKMLAEVSDEIPLFGFDLHAGLSDKERFPGDYTCQIDLGRMGIPENLYHCIQLWKEEGGEMVPYTSWIQDGKLTFRSDRNSGVWATIKEYFTNFRFKPTAGDIQIGVWFVYFIVGVAYVNETLDKHEKTGEIYKNFFQMNDDAAVYPVRDEYGDFDIYFRFKDTEWQGRHDEFVRYYEMGKKRAAELLEKSWEVHAARKDAGQLPASADATKLDSRMTRLFGKGAELWGKEALERASIYVELCEQDPLYQKCLQGMAPPPSIRDVEEMLKTANRYLTDNQHLKPQTVKLDVYLVTRQQTQDAEYVHGILKNAYMLLNYDLMWPGSPRGERLHYTRKSPPGQKGSAENALISITHELFHHREKITKWMDLRTEETLAAYNEYHAAKYYYERGETNSETPREPSPREKYEFLAQTFNMNSTNPFVGYMYADFMDSLQVYTGLGPVFIPGFSLFSEYRYLSSHKSNYMKWFGITDGKVFDDYYKRFNINSYGKNVTRQTTSEVKSTEMGAQRITLQPHYPVEEVTTPKEELITRVLEVFAEKNTGINQEYFNAFMVPDKDAAEGDLAFCWSETNQTDRPHKNDVYLHSENGESAYYAQYCKVPSGKRKFTVVALYQPEYPAKVIKASKGQLKFYLPAPARVLVKKKFISGVEVTLTFPDGTRQSKFVPAKYFNKNVKWKNLPGIEEKDFTLSYHWCYRPDDETEYVSPESKPVAWGAKPAKKKEEPQPVQIDESKGYWKQVNASGNIAGVNIDEDWAEGDLSLKDVRGIEMHMGEGNEVEFLCKAASKVTQDGQPDTYEIETFVDSYVSYTEPPKQWPANTNYTCEWYTAEDPYLAPTGRHPFLFSVENTTSEPRACEKGKENVREKQSKIGGKWLHQAKTVFTTAKPEKDDPKAFTLTQKYIISTGTRSDLKGVVTLVYNYEWVDGEMEEEEKEPEGGHWKLVKKYEDDTHSAYEDHQHETKNALDVNVSVSGGSSRFTLNAHRSIKGRVVFDGSVTQTAGITAPKSTYYPGEAIGFDYTIGDRNESGDPLDYKLGISRFYITTPYVKGEKTQGANAAVGASADYPAQQYDIDRLVAPSYDPEWARTFTIVDQGRAGVGQQEVVYRTVYEYQWADDGR